MFHAIHGCSIADPRLNEESFRNERSIEDFVEDLLKLTSGEYRGTAIAEKSWLRSTPLPFCGGEGGYQGGREGGGLRTRSAQSFSESFQMLSYTWSQSQQLGDVSRFRIGYTNGFLAALSSPTAVAVFLPALLAAVLPQPPSLLKF